MSFADAAESGPPKAPKGPPCGLGLLISGLPDSEKEGLNTILSQKDEAGAYVWQHIQISREVQQATGSKISGGTIGRHRRGDCSCEPR